MTDEALSKKEPGDEQVEKSLPLRNLLAESSTQEQAKAPLEPTESAEDALPIEKIIGSFDVCNATGISGWVASNIPSDKPLAVEILADDQLVCRVTTDILRSDLREAGIAVGQHGFWSMLPAHLFDGKDHVIKVRELVTGYELAESPKQFSALPADRGSIGLDGSALVGWASLSERQFSSVPLEVREGSTIIGSVFGIPDGGDSAIIRFRCSLPVSVLDGRPHIFSVSGNSPNLLIGELVVITPFMLTPETSLRQFAREGLKPSLAVAAGFRYESLARAIEQIVGGTGGAAAEEGKDQSDSASDIVADHAIPVTEQLAQLLRAHAHLVRGFMETDKVFEPLIFPKVEKPRVSIVIPVHNKFYVTYHCLASLLVAANHASFEVILVDDGSKDESIYIPELIKGVICIRNDEAQGFIRACNRGGDQARGEYIVMLNNDTEVTAGWLDELLWAFEHFDNVGLAGAKLLNLDGSLQEAGGIVWNTGDPWNYGRQANPHDPRYNYTRQADYLSGACIMLPLTLWREIGGFDEYFAPAYFEDTDIAFRVRDKGYKTVYMPFSQLIHFEGISSGTSTTSGIKRFQEINRPKFKSRWVGAFRNNGKVGVDLELNKDRNIEFRALVLDAETPMPDQNAGHYAAIQEMRMLQGLGFKCTFVPQNMAWMGHYTEALQRMGVECLFAPFISSVNEVIEKRGSEFDLVYITRYSVAQYYIDIIRKHAPQAKIVMCNADLHFLRELRAALLAKSSEVLARAVETRDAELATMRKVNLVLSYTDVEKAVILSHNLDSTRVAKCPWVTDVLTTVPAFETRTDIAFLGGFSHHPNVEAVEWFVDMVMPMLRETLPGVKFRVYGSNIPKNLLTLAEKNEDLVIEGWVPKVEAVYNTCRVFVVPMQIGAGIKGKVIGALAHGVPCVLSPIAAEGISLGHGVDAFIASKPQEWVAAISRLYQNPQVWADMSSQALIFSRKRYGFAKGVEQMREALQQAEIFTNTENGALVLR